MPDIATNVEFWQVLLAAPLALAGGLGAFLVRRQPTRLLPVLVAFAALSAVAGGAFLVAARAAGTPAIELREVLIAAKSAVVFGLMLLLGASGLAPRRHHPPT
jgi:hypothetical protein